jgi:hypothetical protein
MEFATDQHFVEMCDAEIAKVDTEMSSRGVQQLGSKEETSYQTLLASAPKGPFGSAMDWNLLSLVEGFEIDLQSGDLDLFTPIPGDWRSLAAPVFSASFIGQTEYRPSAHGGLLTLRIDRTVTHSPIRRNGRRTGPTGVPELTIRRMRIAGPPPIAKSSPSDVVKTFGHPLDVHVGLGPNTIGCTVKTEATGTLLLAFDSPLTLHTGDLLQIVVQ